MDPDEETLDEIRLAIYDSLARTGSITPRPALERLAGGAAALGDALAALDRARAVVLAPDGSIRMALPFAPDPTMHEVRSDDGRRWWANCAWDALAIPSLVGTDVTIASRWLDDGAPLLLEVDESGVHPNGGLVHFRVPAGHWWDDIVET